MDDKVQDDVNRNFWKRSLRKRFVNGRIMLRYCPSICAKGLIKTKTVGIAKWNSACSLVTIPTALSRLVVFEDRSCFFIMPYC